MARVPYLRMDGFNGQKVTDEALERRLASICAPGEGEYDAREALDRFWERETRTDLPLKSWGRWAVGAGVLTTAIVIAIVGIKYIPNINTIQSTQSKTYTTTRGQRASITLADGSQVTLAPATTIQVSGRNVELTGEAVFAVINHTGEPFTIKANNTVTRVLGTTFGVRAYDANVRVAVQDGKVGVNSAILSAGDVAITSSNGTAQITHNADAASLLAWTTGRLVLSDVPVSAAIAELSRWYDMDFRVANSELLRRQVTLTIEGPVTNDVLQAVANVLDARMERSGRTVTFY